MCNRPFGVFLEKKGPKPSDVGSGEWRGRRGLVGVFHDPVKGEL